MMEQLAVLLFVGMLAIGYRGHCPGYALDLILLCLGTLILFHLLQLLSKLSPWPWEQVANVIWRLTAGALLLLLNIILFEILFII